jgi:hypothetical protein
VQIVESVNNHCCITVDLDLIGGYAKFFRNGHLLGQAFTGVTAPISPALAFLQVKHKAQKPLSAYIQVKHKAQKPLSACALQHASSVIL